MKPNTNCSVMLRSLAVAGLLALGGCVAHGHVVAHADAPHFVFVDPPVLVTIAPGVWVVHDYHAQIFFVGDAWWHLSGGVWYRAASYDGDWVAVAAIRVPVEIRGIDERRFVYFEGEPGAESKKAPPAHAAAKHGGPPGHRDEPGLRRGQSDDGPGNSGDAKGHDEPKGQDEPGNSGDAKGHDEPGKDKPGKGKGKGPH
jgi:hypothetical protein